MSTELTEKLSFEEVMNEVIDMDDYREEILDVLDANDVKITGFYDGSCQEIMFADYLREIDEIYFLEAFTDTADNCLGADYTYKLLCEVIGC